MLSGPVLYDDTLRDGEQMAGLAFSPAQKLELAAALAGAGVRVLQAGYPASSRTDLRGCVSLVRARAEGRLPRDLELVLMARPSENDLAACLEVCCKANESPRRLSVLLLGSVSDIHLRHKVGRRLLELRGMDPRGVEAVPIRLLRTEALALAVRGVDLARRLGFGLVEVACEDASRADEAWVRHFALSCRDAGARRIALCDTCGVMTPEKVAETLPPLAAALGVGRGEAQLVGHFHDDYGLAAANTIAAARCGATHLAVTLNGLGERCGNAALHRVVVPLRDLYGMPIAGFRYQSLRSLSALAERGSGVLVPTHEPVVGLGAFRHESGLHVAALLEHTHTYQALSPTSVGGRLELTYGKHSGRAGVAAALGAAADSPRVEAALRRVKVCAARRARSLEERQRREALVEARDALDRGRVITRAALAAEGGPVPALDR